MRVLMVLHKIVCCMEGFIGCFCAYCCRFSTSMELWRKGDKASAERMHVSMFS